MLPPVSKITPGFTYHSFICGTINWMFKKAYQWVISCNDFWMMDNFDGSILLFVPSLAPCLALSCRFYCPWSSPLFCFFLCSGLILIVWVFIWCCLIVYLLLFVWKFCDTWISLAGFWLCLDLNWRQWYYINLKFHPNHLYWTASLRFQHLHIFFC